MVHLPTALFSLSYIRDSSNRCSHYAPLRGATVVTRTVTEGAAEFQSTRPMRGATITYTAVPASSWNFNPRAPCGARRQWRYTGVYRCHFNPRAPRGARLALMGNMGVELFISIHARLSGSDRGGAGISIHAPREGRDPPAPELVLCGGGLFQSTRPARGATLESTFCSYGEKFQSTRPARGATFRHKGCPAIFRISIHAPREGRDHGCCPTSGRSLVFQSTRPMRGATVAVRLGRPLVGISIHAPHAGRDC